MARREKDMNKDEEEEGADEPWGTLEELLLACAVNRHGSKSWDSISMELQKRTSHHHLRAFYSPPSCKRKYRDLRRRFTDVDDDGGDDDEERLKTIVDELKKLRVAELRREVERHDVSIEFLQLKVKRLEEEREQSFKPKEEETDLPNVPDNREPKRNSPEDAAGRPITGKDSDYRENGSFNESTSTSNQKAENRPQDGDEQELRYEPETREPKTERPELEPVQTGSKLVSSSSLTLKLTDSAEERGNADLAESKRDVKEGAKQSSEVQSSRKKKQRRRSRFPIASSSGEDEPEGDKVSPAAKQIAIKSQPLIKILVILRSHRDGSLFERRLRSQETEKYRKMIRQHMDLQTVQSRLDKGFYLDSQHKFFRDLLLLFNNAIVFFRKNSPESIAARKLRELVTKEMARAIPMPQKPDPERKQPSPFHSRPNKIAPSPIVVCRRRSSSASVRVPSEVAKTREAEAKLKTKNLNHHLSGNKAAQEKIIKKQGMKEKSKLSRSSRTRKKVADTKNHSEDDDGDDDLESGVKRKESTKKNHGGSGYLKRVKQNYTSKDQVEEDSNDDDDDDDEMEREEEGEEKSRHRRRRDGKKEKESDKIGERERRTDGRRERERESGRRDQRERSSQGRRGRPPKRVAAESRRDVGRGKSGRESGESEVAAAAAAADSGRSRKRYKR